ncbi:choice-of-anchor R domain-containing protein [Paludisphaera mucosa]|uniref:Choice-of-anchor R domain-containing protein n=1 Tax=Paludisphaera mucosa TaxID=3030827 RepID=A0ABT6FLN9_9BACT|nr:choice-of-anchor R domain-containing protein [Paludisphaera mucosa]MDG3008498.1 choice-of-anchor R domain-containing protein [Paludisphaera mucosa]
MGLLLVESEAEAATIYSTLGPNDSFNRNASSAIYGQGVQGSDHYSVAERFTVGGSSDFLFTSAELGVYSRSGTASLGVVLMEDLGGLPGETLESLSIEVGPDVRLHTVTSTLNPLLEAGHSYWLAAVPTRDFNGGWYGNSEGIIGRQGIDYLDFNIGWLAISATSGAFRISGNAAAVPEPSTLAMWATAAAMTGSIVLRRRRV